MIANNLLGHAGEKEEYVVIWPMPVVHLFEADGYVARCFSHVLFDFIKNLEKKGFRDGDISKLFKFPTRIADYAWLLKLKELMKLTPQQRTELYTKLLRYISLYRSDLFCEKGKNILWSKIKIDQALKESRFINVASDQKREVYQKYIGRLNATAWSYTELLFFAAHGMAHEFHGPYDLGDRGYLVVREYFDLNADFWDFTKKSPIEKVTSLEIYKNIDIRFDFFNRTIAEKPLPRFITEISIETNRGEIATLENLVDLLSLFDETVEEGAIYEASLNPKELIKKYIEAHFFTLKPLAHKLGQSWQPPKEANDIVDNEEIKKSEILKKKYELLETIPTLSPEEKYEVFRKMYDPRLLL